MAKTYILYPKVLKGYEAHEYYVRNLDFVDWEKTEELIKKYASKTKPTS